MPAQREGGDDDMSDQPPGGQPKRSLLCAADLARAKEIAAQAPPLPPAAMEKLRLLLGGALTPAVKPAKKKEGGTPDAA